MTLVPLIEQTRGSTLECQHFGSIAVVNTRGTLLAHAGDAHWLTFSRSTLKAFQALPFVASGGPQNFGFSQQQIALLCASHNGEDFHVEQVQDMLDKTGLTRKSLRCGCHAPIFTELGITTASTGPYDERHNNCSGKHAGFLAYCVQHGLPLESYLDPQHPLQTAIVRDVARVAQLPERALQMGIDGCSAPNYAMPLANLALSYARLASGKADPEFGESFFQLGEAITGHPEMGSGTGRNDLAFMRAGRGDWVSKIGADGVQVLGSKSRGEAIAIKIIDGNKVALHAATVEVLDQLGWLDDAQREELRPWRAEAIINANGVQVGSRKAAFRLQASG
ncbi:MAG TPA: asparaginase [Polaromonas sp.]|uniref:asparaginase n=1 Tax=Polaromonas sp. TaxID=1869339 RepID=UPI002D702F22|nr:asparaginase [Polaromonas sp.]HYW57113.1 asparaginase [Polaromonas sp.]